MSWPDRSPNLTAPIHNAPTLSEIEQRLQQLTNAVLAGKEEEARQTTHAALARGCTTNDVLDAIVEAVNIIVDLHEVGEYDQEKLSPAEAAVNSSLQVIEERLATTEGRFNLKATVGPVGLSAGGLLSCALSAVLRSIGFRAANLSKTQTALELLRNSEELGADLVVPLLPSEGVESHLRSFIDEIERGGFKAKFEVIPVAPGLSDAIEVPLSIARNSSEAISKAMEWAMKKGTKRKNE